MRPFDRELADAKVMGRLHAMLKADRGNADEAESMLVSAYSRLQDQDGKPHPLKYGISLALGELALSRGDPRKAMQLGQRSFNELSSRTPTIVVAVLLLIANGGMEAGEFQISSDALRDAKKVQTERGLPPLNARGVTRTSAALAAMQGDKALASTEFAALAERFAAEEAAPMSRLLSDVSKARILRLLGRSEEVGEVLTPWLRQSTNAELPLAIHGEILLLAGEAAIRTSMLDAAPLLRQASDLLRQNDVPTSPRLVRVDQALSVLAQAQAVTTSTGRP
jgi:ATP/maltotriose-dependent transcriptional regulator MalT